jgi:hypothetical protein
MTGDDSWISTVSCELMMSFPIKIAVSGEADMTPMD